MRRSRVCPKHKNPIPELRLIYQTNILNKNLNILWIKCSPRDKSQKKKKVIAQVQSPSTTSEEKNDLAMKSIRESGRNKAQDLRKERVNICERGRAQGRDEGQQKGNRLLQ